MTEEHDLFRRFIEEMNNCKNSNLTKDGRTQAEVMGDLIKHEKEFRDLLLSSPEGHKAYDDFVSYILDDKGNILHAQIFFRERQKAFYGKTSRAFKARKSRHLHSFRINYRFAKWIMGRDKGDRIRYEGPHRRALRVWFNRIAKERRILGENNMPLPINRAKRFWFNVPEVHLQYMDHIQNAAEGLMEAIDKFVPGEGAFGNVVVGRSTLNLMTDQNATLIKFSPKDKRIMYRANTARHKKKMTSDTDVAKYVKEKFDTSAREIERLGLAASHPTSLDIPDQFGRSAWESFADPASSEDEAETTDIHSKLRQFLGELSILDRKIVRLRHGYR